jgi:hypothetical protein
MSGRGASASARHLAAHLVALTSSANPSSIASRRVRSVMSMSSAPRVLSIQSHVVHGCVGNRAASLPLQLLGIETDVLNTVQYSNHVGYGSFAGEKLSGEQVWELLQGMHTNGLLTPTRLLTGYMGSVEAVRAAVRALPLLRQNQPSFRFWCDPVLGALLGSRMGRHGGASSSVHRAAPRRHSATTASPPRLLALTDDGRGCRCSSTPTVTRSYRTLMLCCPTNSRRSCSRASRSVRSPTRARRARRCTARASVS